MDLDKKNIVASIYDNNGNYYLIGKNKEVFLKDNDNIVKITNEKKIREILYLFKPGKTDIIR